MVTLTRSQAIKLKIFGRCKSNMKALEGWTELKQFYFFKCPKHGMVESYVKDVWEIVFSKILKNRPRS
jgi:hypothetical protein